MFEVAAILGAYANAVSSQALARADQRVEQYRREGERWEEEHLRPVMSPEQWRGLVSERTRLREREEDIRREARQHQERLAVEREKVAAIRSLVEIARRFSSPSEALL